MHIIKIEHLAHLLVNDIASEIQFCIFLNFEGNNFSLDEATFLDAFIVFFFLNICEFNTIFSYYIFCGPRKILST